jgi:hypothetical protein
VSLETSTLCGWVGATAAALKPLVDALATDVLAGDTLHVDDTPVPVLAPGTGKTKTGRLWTYVRDERPFGGSRKPAALFFYSPDRKGEHPRAHLKDFRGVIHADGYAGVNSLTRKSSTDCHPSGDGSGASSSQSRLPRHWLLGPTTRCDSSPASLSSPKPSAICGRAGPRWCAASTTADWRSTTIPLSAPCAASQCGVHCTPLPQVSVNIRSWFASTLRHG